jgi:uncharacterized membrane protein YdjX (TVP38/TMEM64 family)/Fe-S oxidoreductase
MTGKCIRCPKCTTECAFLEQNGTPGFIAEKYNPDDPAWLTLAFECSLCSLCAAVCPVHLSPVDLFLEMRREAVDRKAAPLPAHRGIMAYEARGVSRKYSWYSLPDGCDTVLFPGCTFSGTRMDTTIALYERLKQSIPKIGMVMDCCCKPSHDLGRDTYFHDMFGEMRQWLSDHGIRSVIVVCPNCYKVFTAYGKPLSTISAYELPAKDVLPDLTNTSVHSRPVVAIHDPCVLRNEPEIQSCVRKLAAGKGFALEEMHHSMKKTLCCGEGGSVGCVKPEFSSRWGEIRKSEAKNRRLLTYCAGCAGFLNRNTPTDHILDAVFHPEAVAAGNRKATKAPFTYFNRVRLKRYLQKNHPAPVTREREFAPESATHAVKSGNIRKILILSMIAAAIMGIRLSGILEHFDSETLRQNVASLGPLAPVAYMLLYTLAPALFLPGLPITLVGGILFGTFWGVVYSITGATAGACVAFLISRYLARDWIQMKLTGPRWRQLERGVEKNGWKIVAFTRLVPLFPFNLLNYAFGLTPIGFFPYALTSFICMLPACIAFIVFSSSLPDLLKGKASPALIIGIVLIVLVSLIPILVRKLKPRQGKNLELP